jgi:hypothetical protein
MKLTKIFNPEIFAKASLSIMLIALPFDNAVFHLGTLILWVGAFLVSRQPAGPNFGSTIAAQKNVHWAFLSIVVIMVVSNLVNGQGSEAWRTLATFIVRYWLFFALLSYLYMRRIVDMEFLLAVATVGLLVQFVPFIGQMINGQIFVGQNLHPFPRVHLQSECSWPVCRSRHDGEPASYCEPRKRQKACAPHSGRSWFDGDNSAFGLRQSGRLGGRHRCAYFLCRQSNSPTA